MSDVGEVTKVHTTMARAEYLITQIRVIVTYLRLLVFPMNQNLDYDYPLFDSFFAPQVVLAFLLLTMVIGTGVYLLYRDRHAPGAGRLTAFGIFWFFMTLSVESSIIPIADVIFEHRLYLPSVGFFIAITSALFWAAERLVARLAARSSLGRGFLGAAVIVFIGLAVARNLVCRARLASGGRDPEEPPEGAGIQRARPCLFQQEPVRQGHRVLREGHRSPSILWSGIQ